MEIFFLCEALVYDDKSGSSKAFDLSSLVYCISRSVYRGKGFSGLDCVVNFVKTEGMVGGVRRCCYRKPYKSP